MQDLNISFGVYTPWGGCCARLASEVFQNAGWKRYAGGLPLAGQTWQSLGISSAKDSRFNHDPTIYQPSWRIEQTVSYGMC